MNQIKHIAQTKPKTQTFKDQHPFEKRQAEATRIRQKYMDRIPIIAEIRNGSNLPDLDKKKYLVPCDLAVNQFVYVLRKRIKLNADQAIFLFVNNNTLATPVYLMSELYKEHKDLDGFLYLLISEEETFGYQGITDYIDYP